MKMMASLVSAAVAAICVCSAALGQAPNPRPGATTPVQVMNGTSNPVPVQIQGTGNISGTVTVTNTETTPLFVDGTVDTTSADTTTTLYQNFIEVTDTFFGNHNTSVINTKNYKSVRVVAYRGSCSGCADPVNVIVKSIGPSGGFPSSITMDNFLLNTDDGEIGMFASRVYEVPGEAILLSFKNPAPGSTNSVGVLVYGRRN